MIQKEKVTAHIESFVLAVIILCFYRYFSAAGGKDTLVLSKILVQTSSPPIPT
jgi:hypothetical protein